MGVPSNTNIYMILKIKMAFNATKDCTCEKKLTL